MATWVNLLDVIYPVGSMYFSFSPTTPASIIGGSWTQITGKFLYAGTSTTTGGSASHNHSLSSNGGALIDTLGGAEATWFNIGSTATARSFTPSFKRAYLSNEYNASTETAWHSVALEGFTDTNSSYLPPYQAVYCWHRIA